MKRVLLVLIAALLAATSVRADSGSGPDRTTIFERPFGTLYYRSAVERRWNMNSDVFGRVVFRRGLEEIQVTREPDLGVHYPDGVELIVQSEAREVKVLFGKQESTLTRTSTGFTVSLPDDTIRFRRKGREVRIEGRKGLVVVTEDDQGFHVESPAGVTTCRRGGSLQGPRLRAHPYLRRGVHFEHQGVGFFLDFPLEEMGTAFRILEWEPLLLVPPTPR